MTEEIPRKYVEIGMDYLIETIRYDDCVVTKLWKRIGQDVKLDENAQSSEQTTNEKV